MPTEISIQSNPTHPLIAFEHLSLSMEIRNSARRLRDDIQKKKKLNGHCPLSSDPPLPSPKRARWSFFRPPKTTFKRVLQNPVHIDFDNKNSDFCDENSNNLDDYIPKKQTNTMAF